MRILAVTNMYPTPDSPALGAFVQQQVEGLRRSGTEVEVLVVDRLRKGYRAYHGLGRRIRAEASKTSPDLVHVMYGGVMARAVINAIRDLPVVVSCCGSDLLGENLPGLLRKLAVAYGVWCSRFAVRRAVGTVVKSKNLYDALPQDVDRSRVRIIPNGVDLDRFKPMSSRECRARLGWSEGRFHVLFPANTGSPRKRFWLAKAALNKAHALGVRGEIHLLQGVRHEEVAVWLNASDCVILTSEHEGSPNVVKEALACNVPVVSVEVGDVLERIDGVPGCYVASPSPEDLAAKLHLAASASCRLANGRDRIQELSLDRVSQRLRRFYSDVVEWWHGPMGSALSRPG